MAWHRHPQAREWKPTVSIPGTDVHPSTSLFLSLLWEATPDLASTGKCVVDLAVVTPEFPEEDDPCMFEEHRIQLTPEEAVEVGSTLVRIGHACRPCGNPKDLDLGSDQDRRSELVREIDKLLSLKGPSIQMLSADTRRVLEWVQEYLGKASQ